jgi:hypothetical protein
VSVDISRECLEVSRHMSMATPASANVLIVRNFVDAYTRRDVLSRQASNLKASRSLSWLWSHLKQSNRSQVDCLLPSA